MDQALLSLVVTDLTVDSLRESGCVPRWSSSGFIELELNESQSLHFWHPELAISSPSQIVHNHQHEFSAQVLSGDLTHQTFTFLESLDGDSEIVEVASEAGEETWDTISRGFLNASATYNLKQGSILSFAAAGFHAMAAVRSVVLITRGPVISTTKRAVFKIGEKAATGPLTEFTEDDLWNFVDDLLQSKSNAGYHLRDIEKGVLGEASKIKEEIEEFLDAENQGVRLMSLIELSDAYGAINAFLERHHTSISMNDLAEMSRVTRRAFENGRR